MAADILVTDDRRNALEKIMERAYDIALYVPAFGMILLYTGDEGASSVLSEEKSGFSVSENIGGVAVFSAGDMSEHRIIDRLAQIFGSIRREYEIFGDEDDDEGFFKIGML